MILIVSTARYVALTARVLCTFLSLSKHFLHTQVKGSNFTLLSNCGGLCNGRSVWLLFWRLG